MQLREVSQHGLEFASPSAIVPRNVGIYHRHNDGTGDLKRSAEAWKVIVFLKFVFCRDLVEASTADPAIQFAPDAGTCAGEFSVGRHVHEVLSLDDPSQAFVDALLPQGRTNAANRGRQ